MRTRHLLAGLALAGLVAAPSAAFAGQQYLPYDSQAIQAGNAGSPSNPQIDLVRLQASRTETTYTVVSTYTGVPNATRSRYYASFEDVLSGPYDLFELVVKRDGTMKANHYVGENRGLRTLPQHLAELRRGVSRVENVPCKGYSVVTDKAAKTLTFTVPVACLQQSPDRGWTVLVSAAARWTDAAWDGSRPSNDNAKPANKSEGYGDYWDYSGRG